jgi:hypothetical protein
MRLLTSGRESVAALLSPVFLENPAPWFTSFARRLPETEMDSRYEDMLQFMLQGVAR